MSNTSNSFRCRGEMWSHSVVGVVRPMSSHIGHNGNAWMTFARRRCHRAVRNCGSACEPVMTLSNGRMGVPSSRNDLAGLVFFGLAFHGRRRSCFGMLGMNGSNTPRANWCGYFGRALARPHRLHSLRVSVDVVEGSPRPNNNQCRCEMSFKQWDVGAQKNPSTWPGFRRGERVAINREPFQSISTSTRPVNRWRNVPNL